MKKTLVATAVTTLLLSASLSANQLYVDEVNSFSLGGYVDLGLKGSDEGQTQVASDDPVLNIKATHALGNGFTADTTAEWGINYLDGGTDAFTTRLGFVGITHSKYGRAVYGTQYSPYSDVALVADVPIVWGNDFAKMNQGNLGTARADRMISYRYAARFSRDFSLKLGLGWQGKQDELGSADNYGYWRYSYRTQAALTARFNGKKSRRGRSSPITAGVAYSTGSADLIDKDSNRQNSKTAQSIIFSVKYGKYGKGIYAAVVYAMNNYMNTTMNDEFPANTPSLFNYAVEKSNAIEAVGAYELKDNLNLALHYESVKNKDWGKNIYSNVSVQAEYTLMPGFIGFTGYKADLGGYTINPTKNNDVEKKSKDNMWMIGSRVYF